MKTTSKKSFPIRAIIVLLIACCATLAITLPRSVFTATADAAGRALLLEEFTNRVSLVPILGLTATVATDKSDYSPGSTVNITGSGFGPSEQIKLQVIHIDSSVDGGTGHDPWYVTSEPDGSFTATWFVDPDDSLGSTFRLTADGQTSGSHAETTFTDSAIGTYDQCSNDDGDGYASGDTGCRWINGNLQSNNSTYFEGDSTVQRVWLTGFDPGSSHSVTLKYGTTKGGKHAYDFLTTWDASENWITVADLCQDITGCSTAYGSKALSDIPGDPNVPDVGTPNGIEPIAPGSRQFTLAGGTLGIATTPTIFSGDYSGDSETVITVPFTVGPSNGSLCSTAQGTTTCGVVLWFGAHVSKSNEWRKIDGKGGAATIEGSPYHVALDQVDLASVGQRDNQMQANAVIAPASITIVKDATPNGSTAFSFTASPLPLSNFSLTDDGTSANTKLFSNILNFQTYTITENVPPGWNFDGASCQVELTSANGGSASAGLTTTINLKEGENWTCTYLDSQQPGHIIVDKVTRPSNSSQSFTFNPSWGASFPLTDTAAPVDSGPLSPGSYSVSEDAVPGWDLTSWICTSSLGQPAESPTSISLDPNETVTCTFLNTQQATVKVVKNTTGGNDTFNFATSGALVGQGSPAVPNPVSITTSGNASGGTGQSAVYTFSNLTSSGSGLAFNESQPAGWSFVSASVSGDTDNTVVGDVVTLNVNPGETIVVTYANSKPDMNVVITPASATNAVGSPHIFTISVTQFPNGATAATTANIVPVVSPAPGTQSTTCDANVAFSSNVATCTVTINSDSAGSFTLNATATATIGGVSVTRSTSGNSGPGGGGAGTKVFVDAKITLSPLNATNEVGQEHVVTATVQQNTGSGFVAAPDGTLVTFSLLNNNAGATFVGPSSCNTTGGSCSITIVSNSTGGVDIHATTTFSVLGQSLTRSTGDGLSGDSSDAHKNYVSGSISITPSATNEVGTEHIFTVTVTQQAGAVTPATTADISVDVSPVPSSQSTTCGPTVAFSGLTATCTVTINSTTVGTFTATATASFTVDGTLITRTTNGSGDNSAPAVKKYVDGSIAIAPSATNAVGEAHIFTITVTQLAGTATPATTAAITPSVNPAPGSYSTTCGGSVPFVGGVATCTVTINSSTPGVFTANATAVFTIDGVTVTRSTSGNAGPGGSGAAVKTYVASILRIAKVTVPSSDTTPFTFTPGGWNSGLTFNLSNGQTFSSGYIPPGPYSASESASSTFVTTNIGCVLTGTLTPHISAAITGGISVDLAAGEDVTCIFTNSRLPTLTVEKTIKGTSDTFHFTVDGTPTDPPNASIDLTPPTDGTVQSATQIIQLGSYQIDEVNLPQNWLLTDAACTGATSFTPSATGGTFVAGYGDNVLCSFVDNQQGGATRTQGFWATHTILTNAIWNGTELPPGTSTIQATPVIGTADATLCTATEITAISTYPPNPHANQVLGGFWAGISQRTQNPKKRSDIDQARMQMLQQYLAAVLNYHAFGTAIPGTTLAAARTAYCTGTISDIRTQQALLASYNTMGDTVTFTPGVSATAPASKDQADIQFWDTTIH